MQELASFTAVRSDAQWEDVYMSLGILQFWLSALLVSIKLLLGMLDHGVPQVESAVIAVIQACLIAHLGWFGVIAKKGCCCFCVACVIGPLMLLVFAICSGL